MLAGEYTCSISADRLDTVCYLAASSGPGPIFSLLHALDHLSLLFKVRYLVRHDRTGAPT